MMNEELLKILERIASALEKISENLNKGSININQDNISTEFHPPDVDNSKVEIESETIKERQHIIKEFLSSRGIVIKHIPPEDEADEILDKISIFMGNRYNLIKPFLDKVKLKMNSGGPVKIDLKDKTQEEISSICQIATRLYEIAFLEEYTYSKSPTYLLSAKPNRIPQAINFLSGKWLERFVRSQVVSLINQVNKNIEFSYISNPQIRLPNGDDFELDLILEIEKEIYWFEAKSGDYQRYVEKYSKISKILNLDKNHSFMILTDITDTGAEALKSLFNMNVNKIDNFSKNFLGYILKYQISEGDDHEQNTVA